MTGAGPVCQLCRVIDYFHVSIYTIHAGLQQQVVSTSLLT